MRKPSALDKERPNPMIPFHKLARQPLKNFSFFGLLFSNRETAHKPNPIADGTAAGIRLVGKPVWFAVIFRFIVEQSF